jgi:penicillin-binding protein 1A
MMDMVPLARPEMPPVHTPRWVLDTAGFNIAEQIINATRSFSRKYLMQKHKMKSKTRGSGGFLIVLLLSLIAMTVAAAGIGVVLLQRLAADLPPVDALRELQLAEPMRVYTQEGLLIGEFGAERRTRVAYDELPDTLVQAFLAAEDERFFSHDGVDLWGLLRAALVVARTGEKAQGGSTITMQLARNLFLSSEKTYTRKLREILLARRIEETLDKTEILELYLNKIFLGERAYGVGAAAQVYFNKPPLELGLAEAATLAALPKAPSRDNPIVNPDRARDRRDYVLRRMHSAGFIDRETRDAALASALVVTPYRPAVGVDAHYAAEMVRAEMLARYGDAAYASGMRVTTRLRAAEQAAAVDAVRAGLHAYDERQGWRGVEQHLSPTDPEPETVRRALLSLPQLPGLEAAWVTAADAETVQWQAASGERGQLAVADMAWARLKDDQRLKPGDVIRVRRVGERWRLAQVPQAQAAFVALDPQDGGIVALCGGYDFFASKFNRAAQGQRQAGSSFKPFLYAAAIEAGFTPASVVLDAPVVFDDPALEAAWRPRNYSGKFYGPTRLREALVHSRNLVSIRLLQAIGIDPARRAIARFGLPEERLSRDLTMSLGSAVFTPLELAQAYAVFANGGYTRRPWLIERIESGDGQLLWSREQGMLETTSLSASEGGESPQADAAPQVSPVATWLVRDMLREVTVRGTAAKVRELERRDLAGKTGTTNDETDAWFAGFNHARVGVAWVGFDQPQPLGRGEVGGRAALPIWMDYMRVALKGVPEAFPAPPPGIVSVRIDPETGALASAREAGARFEFIQADRLPEATSTETPERPRAEPALDDLF